MQNLQMVDLVAQYQRLKPEIDTAMQAVIDKAAFISGPDVKLFATELEQYLHINHVVPCANGTDALQIALMALNLPEGAEVLVPCFNYVATAEVIALLKLKPVFVEVEDQFYGIDVGKLESYITPNTKVIMPVHLFGQCANMEAVLAFAQKHNLFVVEDVAQAIGATYTFSDGTKKTAGSMGHIGTTSFFPSKNLGCMGDGGAIFTMDAELAQTMRVLANHGQKQKYQYELIGVNSRLDTLQAALLRVKLQHIDDFVARRRAAAAYYDRELSEVEGLIIPKRAPFSDHVFHQYTLQVTKGSRDALKKALEVKGIPSMVYYPGCLHLQVAYRGYGYTEGMFPVGEQLAKTVISLPMHTELTEEQQAYIVAGVKEVMAGM